MVNFKALKGHVASCFRPWKKCRVSPSSPAKEPNTIGKGTKRRGKGPTGPKDQVPTTRDQSGESKRPSCSKDQVPRTRDQSGGSERPSCSKDQVPRTTDQSGGSERPSCSKDQVPTSIDQSGGSEGPSCPNDQVPMTGDQSGRSERQKMEDEEIQAFLHSTFESMFGSEELVDTSDDESGEPAIEEEEDIMDDESWMAIEGCENFLLWTDLESTETTPFSSEDEISDDESDMDGGRKPALIQRSAGSPGEKEEEHVEMGDTKPPSTRDQSGESDRQKMEDEEIQAFFHSTFESMFGSEELVETSDDVCGEPAIEEEEDIMDDESWMAIEGCENFLLWTDLESIETTPFSSEDEISDDESDEDGGRNPALIQRSAGSLGVLLEHVEVGDAKPPLPRNQSGGSHRQKLLDKEIKSYTQFTFESRFETAEEERGELSIEEKEDNMDEETGRGPIDEKKTKEKERQEREERERQRKWEKEEKELQRKREKEDRERQMKWEKEERKRQRKKEKEEKEQQRKWEKEDRKRQMKWEKEERKRQRKKEKEEKEQQRKWEKEDRKRQLKWEKEEKEQQRKKEKEEKERQMKWEKEDRERQRRWEKEEKEQQRKKEENKAPREKKKGPRWSRNCKVHPLNSNQGV